MTTLPISESTTNAVVQLVGPAGFGLLVLCVVLIYALLLLWKRLNVVVDSHFRISSDVALSNTALSTALDRLREKLEK